jgi:two-component system, OmpR family, KDP operon response regulator KdpE
VDDEEPIRRLLRAQLTARSFRAYEACTGQQALEIVQRSEPAIILLDLGLPDIDGIEVIQRLRLRTRAPIIVLSVRAAESDKIAALNSGADNYLTKPWQTSDLFERIRAALWQANRQGEPVFRAGDLAIDLQAAAATIGNRTVQLTEAEYDLLKVLAMNAGRLLTQQQLAREVWGDRPGNEAQSLLRITMGALRQKLETDPACPRRIASEPGVGFRLRTEL